MKQRKFGATGWEVAEVGMGCWQLGGSDWGEVSDEAAFATLRAAQESGVNFFDTADVYGLGRSETLVGAFAKESRKRGEEIVVATKLGRFPEPGWPENFKPDSIRKHTEASLTRMGVETIDLTQLHCIPFEALQRGEVFEALRQLKQEGKIREFGVSVESMEEALFCADQEGVASLQIIFNILRQKPVETLFARARERQIALIARLPLASGLLSGKYSASTQFAANDHRNYNRDGQAFNVGETFGGLPFPKGVELADAIKPLVPHEISMPEMALRWCLDFPEISVIIPGAKNAAQAEANARASAIPPLSEELHARLKRFYDEEVAEHIRGPY